MRWLTMAWMLGSCGGDDACPRAVHPELFDDPCQFAASRALTANWSYRRCDNPAGKPLLWITWSSPGSSGERVYLGSSGRTVRSYGFTDVGAVGCGRPATDPSLSCARVLEQGQCGEWQDWDTSNDGPEATHSGTDDTDTAPALDTSPFVLDTAHEDSGSVVHTGETGDTGR